MESNYEKALRLTAALEELAEREAALLRSFELEDADRIAGLADCAEPLVHALGELDGDLGVGSLLPRIAALMRQRSDNAAALKAHVARVLAELHHMDEARSRLTRFAPVYRAGATTYESRLNAAV